MASITTNKPLIVLVQPKYAYTTSNTLAEERKMQLGYVKSKKRLYDYIIISKIMETPILQILTIYP